MMITNTIKEAIKELSDTFVPVVSDRFKAEDYIEIDLSETNSDLYTVDVSSSKAIEAYIAIYLEKHNKKVAFGGYNETRSIYRRSTHFNQQDPETE